MVWLVIVWVALWGDLSVANVLGGLAIAIVLGLAFPMPVFPARLRLRPWPLVVLLAVFAWDLVRASAEVAWLAWRPGVRPAVAVLQVPLTSDSEAVLAVVAELTSLVPGSIVLELDSGRGRQGEPNAIPCMYVHTVGLDGEDAYAAFRRETLDLERRVVAAFGAGPHPSSDRASEARQ